jgi:hypothetical protein
MKVDELGGTCSTHGKDGKVYTKLWLESLKRRDLSEDPCADVRIILKWVVGKEGAARCEGWTGGGLL